MRRSALTGGGHNKERFARPQAAGRPLRACVRFDEVAELADDFEQSFAKLQLASVVGIQVPHIHIYIYIYLYIHIHTHLSLSLSLFPSW